MGRQPRFYAFDWSKFLTALQGGVLDIFRPPFVHHILTALDKSHRQPCTVPLEPSFRGDHITSSGRVCQLRSRTANAFHHHHMHYLCKKGPYLPKGEQYPRQYRMW
jgi:hypothetical protein